MPIRTILNRDDRRCLVAPSVEQKLNGDPSAPRVLELKHQPGQKASALQLRTLLTADYRLPE